MAIVKFRDENGAVQEVLALRGPQGRPGVDAYAKAVEYGYEGTEEEFYQAMGQHGTLPDTTLTKEGVAADSAVVGQCIDDIWLDLDSAWTFMVEDLDVKADVAQERADAAQARADAAYAYVENVELTANSAVTQANGAQQTADDALRLAQAAAVEKTITTTIVPNAWAQTGYGAWCAFALGAGNNDHLFTRPPFVDVVTSTNPATSKLAEKAFAQVYYIEYSGYDLSLYAHKKPSVDITIQVKVVE